MQRMLMQIIADGNPEEGIDGTPWDGSCELKGYESGWSELRGFSQEAVQEFSGSGSAGIAAATGRINLNNVAVEKSVDKMSPKLFERCCTGKGVDTVIIEVWEEKTGVRMTLVLDGGPGSTNISNYKISGDRYFPPALENTYNIEVPNLNLPSLSVPGNVASSGGDISSGSIIPGGSITGSTRQQKPGYTVTTKETFQFVFTRIRLQVGTKDGPITKGWHGIKNCPDETAIDLSGGPGTGTVRTFKS